MATSELPIGTVVASVFPPDEFAALVGDDGRFNPQSSQWVPADGRSVKGSSYAKALKNSELVHEYVRENAPDLRGVFVRGLNYSNIQSVQQDDNFKDKQDGLPEPNAVTQQGYRMAGTRQLDSINKHDVTLPGQHQVATTMHSGFWAISPQDYNGTQTFSIERKGKETRPKNIALFHYVKIN